VGRGQSFQATAITINGVTTCEVHGLFVDEGGAGGIHVGSSSTDVRIHDNRVDSSRNHGILFQTGASNCTAERNYVTSCCQAGSSTIGSISVIGGSPNTNSISIVNNVVYNSQSTGIRVSASGGVNPEDVRVIGNEVDTTAAQEGITISATRGLCMGNIVKSADVSGILCFGTASNVTIQGNVVHNSGIGTASAAIKVRPEDDAMGAITVMGNVGVDTQGTATQGRVVSVGTSGDSGSIVACIVEGNVGAGNTNSDPVDIGDTDLRANCFIGKNSEESVVNVGTVQTGITSGS
jgi:parallel beta-helix repeat protein